MSTNARFYLSYDTKIDFNSRFFASKGQGFAIRKNGVFMDVNAQRYQVILHI